MGNSPKVLAPGEKWRVEESEYYPRGLEALIKGKIPSQKIMECESRYLLTELKDMAEARGAQPRWGQRAAVPAAHQGRRGKLKLTPP